MIAQNNDLAKRILPLDQLLAELYLPEHPGISSGVVRIHQTAIRWLGQFLRTTPTTEHLAGPIVEGFMSWLVDVQKAKAHTAKRYVGKIILLGRWCANAGIIDSFTTAKTLPPPPRRSIGNKLATPLRRLPKYGVQRHSVTGRKYARIKLNGRVILLGKYGSARSKERYHRIIAEYIASGCSPLYGRSIESITVGQLVKSYLRHAADYYRGTRGEYAILKRATEPLVELYERLPAKEFGPIQLKAARQKMVKSTTTRQYINKRISHLIRMFRWAVSEGLLDVAVPQSLTMVSPLRPRQTMAKESSKVQPVDPAIIAATLPYLTPVVRAMIEFQQLTGCRPGEVCVMRPCDVAMGGPVWEYRPSSHKTEHLEIDRVIYIGPRAQKLIQPYLKRPAERFCFSPRESRRQARALQDESRPKRKTRRYPSEARRVERAKRSAARRARQREQLDRFTTGTYRQAVRRACRRAFGKLSGRWTPNQLRHTAATEFRKRFGLEATQVLLGHARADITQVYAERNFELAVSAAKLVG